MKQDFLIVSGELHGSVFAHGATTQGKKCPTRERSARTEVCCHANSVCGMCVRCHGAHILHAYNERARRCMRQPCAFNRYVNRPLDFHKGMQHNLPINMNAFLPDMVERAHDYPWLKQQFC